MDIKAFGSTPEASNHVKDILRAVIGDDRIPFEVINISSWRINETAARSYSKQKVSVPGRLVADKSRS